MSSGTMKASASASARYPWLGRLGWLYRACAFLVFVCAVYLVLVELGVIGPHQTDTKYMPDVGTIVKIVVYTAVAMVTLMGFADASRLLLEIGDRSVDAAEPKAAPTEETPPKRRAAPAAPRFIECGSCGAKTEADSRFCQKCGKPIEDT